MREIFKCEYELLMIEDFCCFVSVLLVLSVCSLFLVEDSFIGRKVIEDYSLSLSSIYFSFNLQLNQISLILERDWVN